MARIMHFEITGEEPEKVMDFYKEVFKWEFTKWEAPFPYWMIKTGDPETPGIDGGLTQRGDFGTNTVNTIDVEDLDGMIEAVKENGGTIVVPKMAVPTIGWMCYFKDPYGSVFGMMQDDPNAE